MPKKPEIYKPTEAEDAEIQRGIDADPDTFVPTDEHFARMKRRGSAMNPSSESGGPTDSKKSKDPK